MSGTPPPAPAPHGYVLPPYVNWTEVLGKLDIILPGGTEKRPNIVNDPGARVVFVALFTGAVAGANRWIAPRHVIWMGPTLAASLNPANRDAWSATPTRQSDKWYQENSRELRDTVITKGLIPIGAMVDRGIPQSSNLPRYALAADFAALFDPALVLGSATFDAAAAGWRARHLSKTALTRIAIVKATAQAGSGQVAVNFPGGGGTVLPAGPSPLIIKAVVEVFAPGFLGKPVVIWISDSKNKNHYEDKVVQGTLGLTIDVAKTLPDLIIVDMEPPGMEDSFLVLFVEAVATEGPIDGQRREELTRIVTDAGYAAGQAAFLTAYLDKVGGPFRATGDKLAWGSFAWFASQPDQIVQFHTESTSDKLSRLLAPTKLPT